MFPLSIVNNMAAAKPLELGLDIMALPRPPEKQPIPSHKEGFQYRGTLFRPSSASTAQAGQEVSVPRSNTGHAKSNNRTRVCGNDNMMSTGSPQKAMPRRIQSAKGRLEKPPSRPVSAHSSGQLSSSSYSSVHCRKEVLSEKSPSVIDLNCAVNVPDKEEEMLVRRASLHKCDTEQFYKPVTRPSSAKSTFSNPPVTETKEDSEGKNDIKPSVVGLRFGRHVFGNEPDVQEAWANTERDFPFKMSAEQREKRLVLSSSTEREIPATLEPLRPYLTTGTPKAVVGVDPATCLVFLAHDYSCDELPEVPTPQSAEDPLPYSCVVATPRKQVPQKFSHPFYDKQPDSSEWVCKHTTPFIPETHSDISYLLNPPVRRDPHEVRREITELEDLLLGIGSLDSSCSFVKFQAEIRRAKFLAKKLISQCGRFDEPEPVDTFGLLQFCKDHDEIMKVIHERRDRCLKELAELETAL